MFQYSVLHHMIAQVSNMVVGTITFNIDNAHYYDRHIDGLEEQMENPMKKAPTLKLNKSIKSFYDFTIDDVIIEGYDKNTPKIKFEVAE